MRKHVFRRWTANLDLYIFSFVADNPLVRSFELIDGNFLVTISKDTVPGLLALDPRGIESR